MGREGTLAGVQHRGGMGKKFARSRAPLQPGGGEDRGMGPWAGSGSWQLCLQEPSIVGTQRRGAGGPQ